MLKAASLLKKSGTLSLIAKACSPRRRLKSTAAAAYLELEDGTILEGKPFGAARSCTGEVVFNTGMVGYPEALSDPSYKNQILTLTYPLVGNYGVPPKTKDSAGLLNFFESDKIHISGLIVGDYTNEYSHWNAVQSLGEWLQSEGVPALSGIDTRSLTRVLRERGCMAGKIVINNDDLPIQDPLAENLVAKCSIPEPRIYGNGDIKIIAVDCGMKFNIIRQLTSLPNTTIKIVPWNYDFTQEHYDGLFLSNGPGDPALVTETIEHVKKAIEIGKPIFGICLGNQLLGLAAGAKTVKLKYGNRGQNQPVIDLTSNQVYITPQNHGFAVDVGTLPADWKPYFVNANDGSNEGIMHTTKPIFSVQFHPEARGGPYDTKFLFQKFYKTVTDFKSREKIWENKNFNTKVKPSKVLIIGSGALQIGQAGEFDYSGSQCIKALKEEGVKSVLVNPNIATVQTSKGVADQVYFLPATTEFIERVIQKERPDGILLGFGGQTGLNTGVELAREGVFKKYGVEVLGSSVETIEATEDRELFNKKLSEINEPFAKSFAVTNVEDALTAAKQIGYPVVVRAAYALGGLGSGFAANQQELVALASRALSSAPQILVEKSLKGWKEVEYEVVRDQNNNCITVCNMENFDPMGIHTGDSIVVAPSQTLTNEEYHMLRSAAIRIVQHLGIIGECNIQYALNPQSQEYIVIEVNPRLSRSSALASKATGYPLAFVAAKIAVGVPLSRIQNSVTKSTLACFEPSLDYIVTKVPRWDLAKFKQVDPHLGSSMKSVGEVMAIGRTWEESIQKALRMVDTSNNGFEPKFNGDIDDELLRPTPQRIFAIAKAFEQGYSVDKIHDMTKIDKWFLNKLQKISKMRGSLKENKSVASIDLTQMKEAKQAGFSDKQIGTYVKAKESEVRAHRKSLGVVPHVKQIDTLAAEFPAQTNYLYMTYNATASDIPEDKGGVMVLGSGTYRIGSSVEFDYGAVSCSRSLQKHGQKTIMVNYNPETVSTDYDESDKLYFEELSLERVLDIHDRENPLGTVVSVGGQQPQNIALTLHNSGVNVLGTKATNIDIAEDRYKFSKLLDSIGVAQPEWKELSSMKAAKEFAGKVGYPVLIRPSYVLSGAAMNVAADEHQLETFLSLAADVNPEHPVVITKFVTGAKEVELDAVAQNGELINWAIAEHIEHAGVHSGDATMVLPAHDLPTSVLEEVKTIGTKIATALNINGPCNIQFLVKDNKVSVIECNLRASRSVPFASKTYDVDFVETATKIFLGEKLTPNKKCEAKLNHVAVKAPQFSFQRLLGADPAPGIEMTSTGEVACFGDNKYEAFLKSLISVPPYFKLPNKNKTILLSGNIKDSFIPSAKTLAKGGYALYASSHVAPLLTQYGVEHKLLTHKDGESELIDHILQRKIDLVINFPTHDEDPVNYQIRRRAVDFGVPCLTNEQICSFLATALTTVKEMPIKSYADYFPEEEKLVHKVEMIVKEELMSSK